MFNADYEDLSESESIVVSEANIEFDEETNFFLGALAKNVGQNHSHKKKEKQASRTNVAKYAKYPNKIFDYIHVTCCQRLFSLAWYNDLTYVQSKDVSYTKELSVPYCNGPSCNSTEPDYIQREPFINTTTPTTTEVD